jgi:hypothetical protein
MYIFTNIIELSRYRKVDFGKAIHIIEKDTVYIQTTIQGPGPITSCLFLISLFLSV